jgi:hypothetical protein
VPEDPEERAALVFRAFYDLARDHEAGFRLFLQASVLRPVRDPDAKGDPYRGARREALLADALASLSSELSPEELERLKAALAMLTGIELMVVLRDILRLDHDQARDTGEWAVRQLVRPARPASR